MIATPARETNQVKPSRGARWCTVGGPSGTGRSVPATRSGHGKVSATGSELVDSGAAGAEPVGTELGPAPGPAAGWWSLRAPAAMTTVAAMALAASRAS